MAHEDEELYAVLSVSSDNLELNDYTCMPCNQHFVNSKALHYCEICKKQFCSECHSKHAYLFKEHEKNVLGEDSKMDWVTLDINTEQSSKRSGSIEQQLEEQKYPVIDDEASNSPWVKNTRVYNIKVEGDRRLFPCNITSCCYLPDARIVLVDCSNRRLKLLSEDKYIMAVYDLAEEPHEVCYVDENYIAVTMAGNTVMTFQVTNLGIEKKDVVTFKHECRGIACSKNQFYIGDFQRIYVYTRDGKPIHLLYSNMSMGKNSVKSFAISEDGNMIYIANYDNSVLRTIDTNGKTHAMFKDPDLKNPTGVCVGNDGSVFACGTKSNSVIHVDGGGMRKLGLLSRLDGLSSPQSLCFNGVDSTLVVCQQRSNAILVVTINSVTA